MSLWSWQREGFFKSDTDTQKKDIKNVSQILSHLIFKKLLQKAIWIADVFYNTLEMKK